MKNLLLCLILAQSYSFFSQTYFSENFNSGFTSWTIIDGDNDPEITTGINTDVWNVTDLSFFSTEFSTILGNSSAFSFSSAMGADLHPNNFLISDTIDLTTVPSFGLNLIYSVGTPSSAPLQAEHYAIYVSTASDTTTILSTTPVFEETIIDPNLINTRYVNLSAYAGQKVFLTFRHYNTIGMGLLIIDNIELRTISLNDANLIESEINKYAALNSNNPLSIIVKNDGLNPINSLSVDWNDGSSHLQTISGLNIASGSTDTITHPTMVSASTAVEKTLNITITEVNSTNDSNPANNNDTIRFNTVSTIAPKKVVFEEGTGTWCGWCPRGTVAMESILLAHPNEAICIAVHAMDSMELTEYATGANFSSFPNVNVNRKLLGKNVASSLFEEYFLNQISIIPPAQISINGTLSGNNLTVYTNTHFYTPITNAEFNIAVVITEDNVHGTTGYDQTNYYSFESGNYPLVGAGHDWQSETNPIPASNMNYDHVGRVLLGGYNGLSGTIPTTILDGTISSSNFTYTIPDSSNINNLNVVALLIDNSDGSIVNATSTKISQLGINEPSSNFDWSIFPNPTSNNLNVNFEAKGENYQIVITDLIGKVVNNTFVLDVTGNQSIVIPTSNLKSGNYFITILSNNASYTKEFIVY